MAAALVSAIIQQLATIAAENARQEFKLVTGVKKEVQNLESNFKAIQCVLEDAEERQVVNKSVGYWLERLKQVSYDMDDVLDEWKFALQKLETETDEVDGFCVQMKKKVCNFFSCIPFCHQVARRHDIAARIKEINEELDQIAKEKERYQLATRIEMKQPRSESTSFVDISKIHGREVVKSKIKSMLLGKEKFDGIRTISIVGMGGIGKTALAQMICNDDEVREHFNKVIWVCVSDSFDQNQIARAILGGLDQDSTNLQTLQNVLDKICENIESARFLLVLDDVWTDRDEDWQALRATFQQGMPGSRILVTTRKESVAIGLGSSPSQMFPVKQLSDDVCWSILSQVALIRDDDELLKSLEDVGREVAKKCRGLPLAAKTLGSLLREKKNKNEWRNVLNSEVWELDDAKEYIFKPLLLSYYDLPSEIRPCLLYCAMFPKDYQIYKKEMIKQWIAQGYLYSCKNSGMEEEKAEEYFNYLASHCFFQDLEKGEDGKIWRCKMHDMVHDFIQFLTKQEIVSKEFNSSEGESLHLSSQLARHLRITIGEGRRFPMSINRVGKLRSLLAIGQKYDVSYEALQSLFNEARCLRILEFGIGYGYLAACVKEIPEDIGKLIHLRYLNLRFSYDLKKLPKATCELRNLQYLNLSGCLSLEELPGEIEKLINLRYLYTRFCHELKYYPKGIRKLTGLRELDIIKARIDCNDPRVFCVGDLENLDLLSGALDLHMEGNTNLGDSWEEEVKRAEFQNKVLLTRLNMTLMLEGRSAEQDIKNNVMQALNLPSNLHPHWW